MSVDHLWDNECEAESDGGDSGTEYNERKREISYNPARHLDSQ